MIEQRQQMSKMIFLYTISKKISFYVPLFMLKIAFCSLLYEIKRPTNVEEVLVVAVVKRNNY